MKNRRLFLRLFLLIASSVPAFLLAAPCDYVYSQYEIGYIPYIDVVYGDDATVLHFKYPMMAKDAMDFSSMYLSDKKGKVHELLNCEIVREQGGGEEKDSILHVLLSFEPIKKDDRLFDLLSSSTSNRHLNFWGLHASDDSLDISSVKDYFREYNDSSLVRPGKSVLRGRIIDWNRVLKDSRNLRLNYSSFLSDGRMVSDKVVSLSDEGCFEVNCELDGHTCIFIEDEKGKFRIPVYLTPGDTMDVTVSDVCSPHRVLAYQSAKGRDAHEALMAAFCNTVITDGHAQNRELFCSYMTQKYGLTPYEHHLLLLELQGKVYNNKFSDIDYEFRKKYCSTPEQYYDKVGLAAAIHSEEARVMYGLMREIDWRDMSLRVLPYQLYTQMIICCSPLQYSYSIGGVNEALKTMEEYAGSTVGEGWRKIMVNNN